MGHCTVALFGIQWSKQMKRSVESETIRPVLSIFISKKTLCGRVNDGVRPTNSLKAFLFFSFTQKHSQLVMYLLIFSPRGLVMKGDSFGAVTQKHSLMRSCSHSLLQWPRMPERILHLAQGHLMNERMLAVKRTLNPSCPDEQQSLWFTSSDACMLFHVQVSSGQEPSRFDSIDPTERGGGKPGWMLDPTQRGPPEDNTVKCQRMSPCNAINYTLLYLVLSTGYEIVIKTAYLSLVNMQTDDLRELGPLCDEFRVTISCALRLLSLNKLVRVMQMMWELLEIWLERN